MLKRITCDVFKTQPTPFRKGLNVVLGSSDGSNAIGKTTFLLILDFVFGGDDYAKMAKDSIDYVPHHEINIEFEFDDLPYFFSRSTSRPNMVNRCNNKFRVIDDMTVQKYREFLYHEYKVLLPYIGFDDITDRFFRIYGHGNHNERRPLQNKNESLASAAEHLMKLLAKYEDIHNLKIAEDEFEIRGKQSVRTATDILADISKNNRLIEGQKKRLEKLNTQNEEANLRVLGIDSEQAERLADVSNELRKLNSRKSKLLSQLNAVRNNIPDDNSPLRKDFSVLHRFFPDANLDAFQEVEQFHEKITGFLSEDIKEEIARLEPLIQYVDSDIAKREKIIIESGIARNLSRSILTQYASVTREIEKLNENNDELNRQKELIEKRKEIEALLANLRRKQGDALIDAEIMVNTEMERINRIITSGDRQAPVLTLISDKGLTFDFETPNDRSEGTAFKGLIIYDLTMLSLSPIPALIHDSSIVKRVEDTDFERILGLYEESGKRGKQVFIAFDKADSAPQAAEKMLEANAVLRLSVNNVLFGTLWSRKQNRNEFK